MAQRVCIGPSACPLPYLWGRGVGANAGVDRSRHRAVGEVEGQGEILRLAEAGERKGGGVLRACGAGRDSE